jgi:predicted small metal-binding protein
MQKLACKDIGVNGSCPFEATGNSTDETVDMAMEHLKRAHADEVSAMGVSDDDLRATAGQKVRDGEEASDEAEEGDDKDDKADEPETE